MTTEFKRRIIALEKKFTTGELCNHLLPIVYSDEEAVTMIEMLDGCPRCSQSSVGLRMLIIRYPGSDDSLSASPG